MIKTTNKGFTLIELLVVIAIIGILSSVVLASLNTARNKGADAAIKSQLAGLRAQAEILYDTPQCYVATGGTCAAAVAKASGVCSAAANTIFADTKFYSLIQAAITTSGVAYNSCAATVNGGAWAVAVPTKTALQTGRWR
jgi:prepilin-type N-terminal cleavage/methylation domain-containing protein